MDNPVITIDLAPHLQDFLYHEFSQSTRDKPLMIDTKNDIGRFIQSMVTVTDMPRKQELKDSPIEISLPIREWNHALFRQNFIYVPEWKQKQIRLFVESLFRLRLREFFMIGYSKGFKQDLIIRSFLEYYNIKHNALNYDTVKKYDYRTRRKMRQKIAEEIESLL